MILFFGESSTNFPDKENEVSPNKKTFAHLSEGPNFTVCCILLLTDEPDQAAEQEDRGYRSYLGLSLGPDRTLPA